MLDQQREDAYLGLLAEVSRLEHDLPFLKVGRLHPFPQGTGRQVRADEYGCQELVASFLQWLSQTTSLTFSELSRWIHKGHSLVPLRLGAPGVVNVGSQKNL